METLTYAISSLDQFTLVIASLAAVVSFWLMREMTGSTALASIAAPLLLVGALAGNYLFRANFVVATHDKDTNVVVASAVGVLVALVMLLIAIWIMVMMSERRARNRELMQLPDVSTDSGK